MPQSAESADNNAALQAIFALEKQLMADINDFNIKYSCYLRSNANQNEYVQKGFTQSPPSFYSCTSSNSSAAQVTAAYNKINTDITELKSLLQNYTGPKTDEYNTNFNYIISQYDEVITQRTDMDKKLSELYGVDDGINNYYVNQYRATMFSKIMLTILVTSLVYYTFMKIIKK
jgi:hypothetical protein